MTADHSPGEGRQRTVAELLQQYGEGQSGGSRRRRRAEDRDEPAAVPEEPRPAPSPVADQPPAGAAPEPYFGSGTGYGRAVDPLTGEPIDPLTGRAFTSADPVASPYPSSAGGYPYPPAGPSYPVEPFAAGTSPGYLPAPAEPDLPAAGGYEATRFPVRPADPATETMPRYPRVGGAAPGPMTGPLTGPMTGPLTGPPALGADLDAGPPTGQVSGAELFDDDPDGDSGGDPAAGPGPAGLSDVREAEKAAGAGRGGVARWAAMAGQWLLGAVAGALLWVGFSYLWRNYPVIALVAAVVATAALVLVVRAIRRSDDLQTTMLAVLVGLVVTISPAVLLLAVR